MGEKSPNFDEEILKNRWFTIDIYQNPRGTTPYAACVIWSDSSGYEGDYLFTDKVFVDGEEIDPTDPDNRDKLLESPLDKVVERGAPGVLYRELHFTTDAVYVKNDDDIIGSPRDAKYDFKVCEDGEWKQLKEQQV